MALHRRFRPVFKKYAPRGTARFAKPLQGPFSLVAKHPQKHKNRPEIGRFSHFNPSAEMHPFSLFSASKAPKKWLCDAICRKKQLFAGSFGSRSHSFCSFTREAVKRDNNNVYDFLDSDGYVRLKADLSASSKELYEAYQIYCAENNLPALKPRSFSEALIACQSCYNLEYCNNVTNAAGRRVRGFLRIEVLVRNHISVFSGDSMRTYVPEDVPEEWRR